MTTFHLVFLAYMCASFKKFTSDPCMIREYARLLLQYMWNVSATALLLEVCTLSSVDT